MPQFVVLAGKIVWTEIARVDSEQEAHKLAAAIYGDSTPARIVSADELAAVEADGHGGPQGAC